MHKYFLITLLGLASSFAGAQQIGYISDKQFIPVRSGQGSEFRIVHRGLPSGTAVTIGEVNEESGYTHITTRGGTQGWVRSQYLMRDTPARVRLDEVLASNEQAQEQLNTLRQQMAQIQGDYEEAVQELEQGRNNLATSSQELTEIRRISGNAIALDGDNRRLVEEVEVLKSRMEVLQADNTRLMDSTDNEAFINGALAVLLGVMITLLVPRLWPQKRKSSSWA